jgi:hypothetical protein
LLSATTTAPFDTAFYSFTANAGDVVTLTLTNTSGGFDPSLELYDSGGTIITSYYQGNPTTATITRTLSTAGTYYAIAFDTGYNETGSYTITLQKNNNSCP